MPVIRNIEEGSWVSKQAVDLFKNGGQFGESRQAHELSTVYSKKLFHTFKSALSPKEDVFPTELFFYFPLFRGHFGHLCISSNARGSKGVKPGLESTWLTSMCESANFWRLVHLLKATYAIPFANNLLARSMTIMSRVTPCILWVLIAQDKIKGNCSLETYTFLFP